MQTPNPQPLLELFFGPYATLCWELLPYIKVATADMTYSWMPKTEYDLLVQQQPLEACAVYWKEMIQRVHLGSSSALLRHEQWLKSMTVTTEGECYFGFLASYRGFVESTADATYSLGPASSYLARNLPQIMTHIGKRTPTYILGSYELEERLIHFSHGRRLVKGETAEPAHAAKQMKEYITTLAEGAPKVSELYAELCSITHPSAETVALWYSPGDEQGSIWKRAGSPTIDSIKNFMGRWRETSESIFQLAFVPLLFNLRILHKFDFLPQISQLKTFPFSRFPAWKAIDKALRR
jgi:hypothetical protein